MGGETLAQVAQRGSGGSIPGNIQGQVGRDSEQPGLVEGIPALLQGGWARWSLKVPSNPKHSVILQFYDSVFTSDAVVFNGKRNVFYFKACTEQEFTKNSYITG